MKSFVRSTIFPLVLIAALAFSCNVDQAPEKPNIVFIFIDDMGWTDVGFMGSTYYETPNIDRLANQGMIFTNAYANAANCAPTRASLLSGQYSPRHGVFTVARPDRGKSQDRRLIPTENSRKLSPDKITIAEALKPAGYVSAAIGKWHVGNDPKEEGFDYSLNKYDIGYEKGHFDEKGRYLTDRFTNEAVNFITQNKDNQFFLYLAHDAVHTPIQAKEEIVTKFQAKEGEGCHDNAKYAAMIESVDQSVGKINRTLEELGLSENTILIFFSDNGGHGTFTCQKPLRGGKGMFYEGGIRVPMFAYWPEKIKGGTTNDDPIISTDFYTTFLELAGAKSPDNYTLDGESIVPLFNGEQSVNRDAIYWHFPAYLQSYDGLRGDSRDTTFRARPVSVIRKGDWKLFLFHEEWVLDGGREKIGANNAIELYNLNNDIGEKENLANTEVVKREELLDQLLDWMEEIEAPIPENANPEYFAYE
ncbi:MAG: sulfatase [Cytophagales bacterium]|nr:sulfatase [Cytophagales bacterium]